MLAEREGVVSEARFEADLLALLPRMLSTAHRLCGNRVEAEDLVADTVSKAWAARQSLRDPATLRGWLFRILNNTYASSRRSGNSERYWQSFEEEDREEGATFSLFEKLHQPFLLWWSNPEQAFLDRLLQSDLDAAIAALPEHFRVVVLLGDVQGFSYQEMAETLGIPIGTVRSRLARGRALLQKALWRHGEDAGLITRTRELDTP